ncbi:MAG: NAD-dependent epimerase/dehydratase family protein [Methylococcales bacterium]|nr:NAD-dependent epimerase/dehydratase family protein [Methylococcales bacterium]
MADVLIAGCGDLGQRLANRVAGVHRVIGVRRQWREVPDTLVPHTCDLTDARAVASLPRQIDALIFTPTPGARGVAAYQAIYQTALTHIIEHYANHAPLLLMVSSTSVYGQHRGEWVDEDSVTEPRQPTSQCIVQGELLWAAQPQALRVRLSGIYGPGRSYLLNKARQAPLIAKDPPYYSNRIHQDDAVSALLLLLNKAFDHQPLAPLYLVTDDDPAPLWDVVSWLAAQQGCPPPQAESRSPGAEQNKRCRNARIKALGLTLAYPDYRHGYQNFGEWR